MQTLKINNNLNFNWIMVANYALIFTGIHIFLGLVFLFCKRKGDVNIKIHSEPLWD